MRTNARQRIDKERAAQPLRFGEDSACEEGPIGLRHHRRGDPRRQQLPRARMSCGTARNIPVPRISPVESQPTRQPAAKSMGTPISIAASTTQTAIRMTRERISRPRLSLPKGNSAEGGRSRCMMWLSHASAGKGAIQGVKIATTSARSTMNRPIATSGFCRSCRSALIRSAWQCAGRSTPAQLPPAYARPHRPHPPPGSEPAECAALGEKAAEGIGHLLGHYLAPVMDFRARAQGEVPGQPIGRDAVRLREAGLQPGRVALIAAPYRQRELARHVEDCVEVVVAGSVSPQTIERCCAWEASGAASRVRIRHMDCSQSVFMFHGELSLGAAAGPLRCARKPHFRAANK